MSAPTSRFSGRTGPIRLGMVGGGQGAFIGAVHRIAARLDGHYSFVAGALSSRPETARASGRELGLSDDRIYDDFAAMAAAEATRDDGIEAVAVVTPNHLHATAARAFLAAGIHVICDKPLTATLEDAEVLAADVARSDALFVLTHNYTGYAMVRQAREMVAAGALGRLHVVQVEYPQGWLATGLSSKQADWRGDPERAGPGGATGDIGTHAIHLARFVTGLQIDRIAADLDAFVPGRRVDDNAHVLIRYRGGAKGMLWCSQVAVGQENGLALRLYGATGSLVWRQEEPDRLWFTPLGEPSRLLTRNGAGATGSGVTHARVPAGHPEGYLEGFATLYAEAAEAIRAHRSGRDADPPALYPGIEDGLFGVRFVAACVRSSRADAAWTPVE